MTKVWLRALRRIQTLRRRIVPYALASVRDLAGGSQLAYERSILPAHRIESSFEKAEPRHITGKIGEKIVYALDDVFFWTGNSVAADASGRIIRDTCSSEYRLGVLARQEAFERTGKAARSEHICTAIECGPWWNNHYHWLVDMLPRIWALHQFVAENGDNVIELRLPEPLAEDRRALLAAMAPSCVRIRHDAFAHCVRASRYVWLPCLSEDYCGYLPREYLDFFLERAFAVTGVVQRPGTRQRILISRRAAQKRRLQNEDKLAEVLAQFGFARYALEEMPFPAQVRLFRDAEIVVAPHGAGLTNTVFSKSCKILELFPCAPLYHYRWLAVSLGHNYMNLCAAHGVDKNADVSTTVDCVVERLQSAGWI